MSVHYSLESLSSYIDSELDAREYRAVEKHVQECSACRKKLAGLESAVSHLRRLETVSAPSTLGLHIERRTRLESQRQSFPMRMEDGLYRVTKQPLFAPLFALIVAFGVILYLFSLGVARQTSSDTRIVIGRSAVEPREVTAPAAGGETGESGGTSASTLDSPFERPGGIFLAGRWFTLRDGIWQEEGTGGMIPQASIDVVGGEVLPEELHELLQRAGTFRLVFEGRLVEVVVPEPPTSD